MKKKKIKNMNGKVTKNSQLSTTEPKKQEWKQTSTGAESQMEITWRVISGVGEGGEWGKGTGNRKQKL